MCSHLSESASKRLSKIFVKWYSTKKKGKLVCKKGKEYKIPGDRIVSKRKKLKIKYRNHRYELRNVIIKKVTNARHKKTYTETLKGYASKSTFTSHRSTCEFPQFGAD